jgi:hypothetical protein
VWPGGVVWQRCARCCRSRSVAYGAVLLPGVGGGAGLKLATEVLVIGMCWVLHATEALRGSCGAIVSIKVLAQAVRQIHCCTHWYMLQH